MKRILGLMLLQMLSASVVSAQMHPWDDSAALASSVIRIRTVADLEIERIHPVTGESRKVRRPYSIDGTGVVIGATMETGRREYYILTNHHVADASNYVLEEAGYLRMNPRNTAAIPRAAEESYLLSSEDEMITDATVRLVEVVRRVQGDMTLMRTDGVTGELAVFEGRIGYTEGEVLEGSEVVTAGYPLGGDQITASGTILETDHPHALGVPHHDFILDLPVERGQSGGPIFLVERDTSGAARDYRLIGLVHAKDKERNYGVSYLEWGDALADFPRELQQRLVR